VQQNEASVAEEISRVTEVDERLSQSVTPLVVQNLVSFIQLSTGLKNKSGRSFLSVNQR
jgi:hypothetical protein